MRAHSICSTSKCLEVATSGGKCETHKRPAWQNMSARNKTLPSDWKRRQKFVLRRDKRKCYLCGKSGAAEVDHVLSVAKGGTHDYSNLKAVHSMCHLRKSLQEKRTNN